MHSISYKQYPSIEKHNIKVKKGYNKEPKEHMKAFNYVLQYYEKKTVNEFKRTRGIDTTRIY